MLIRAKTFRLKVKADDCDKLVHDLDELGVIVELVDKEPIRIGSIVDDRVRVYCTSDPFSYDLMVEYLENTTYTVWLTEAI